MAVSSIRIDQRGVQDMFQSPNGDVRQYLERQAKKIVALARMKAGKETGRLIRSIGFRVLNVPNGIVVEIGSGVRHALMHHEGTRPHVINASPGRVLRFKQGGRVVYAQRVYHPGTRPNRYLTDAMRIVIR